MRKTDMARFALISLAVLAVSGPASAADAGTKTAMLQGLDKTTARVDTDLKEEPEAQIDLRLTLPQQIEIRTVDDVDRGRHRAMLLADLGLWRPVPFL